MDLIISAKPKENDISAKLAFRALIHISTMQRHRLCSGDFVAIRCIDAPGQSLIARAWPSFLSKENEVQLSSLALVTLKARIGDVVQITKASNQVPAATSIVVVPVSKHAPLDNKYLTMLVHEVLIDIMYSFAGLQFDVPYQGKPCRFAVTEVSTAITTNSSLQAQDASSADGRVPPMGIVLPSTSVLVTAPASDADSNKAQTKGSTISKRRPTYDAIGGLDDEVRQIRETVEWSLKSPEIFSQYGMRPPRGILLYGPPGTGKTLIARTVAAEVGAHAIVVNGAEIMTKFYGETEAKVRDLFGEARANAPSIIFIDEIDALCPKRENSGSEVGKRVVATLLTLMDGVEEAGSGADRVVVLAATNRPNSLDEALRRPGRFDREIEIGIPDPRGRRSILDAILRGIPNTLSESDVHEVAMRTHGYVGADLSALCREAGLLAIKRHSKAGKQVSAATLAISIEDLEQAVGLIKPSTMREVMLEVPNVRWQDIGGQDEIKQKLKEAVEWPLKHPQSFLQMGITPPKGVLLYGPPGCSKTLTAKALATESGLNFIAVKGPELFSKWVGESEKAVHEIFRKARAAAPSIVFFDEIDAIAVKRGASSGSSTSVADRVLSQLLNEMDGVEPLLNVTVVAATNRPDIIDSALLRPGRIDRVLYVGPPDLASRKAIFDIQLRKMAVADDVSTVRLAEITEEFSGAEVVALCQEAAMAAMEEDLNAEKVEARHFEACRAKFKQRTTPEMLEFYRRFQEQCGLS